MCLFWRIGVYDGRDTFFEGVQAGRHDHGLGVNSISAMSSLLRDLLKQDTPWCWEEAREKVYSKLKETLSEESKLNYFSTQKDVTLSLTYH